MRTSLANAVALWGVLVGLWFALAAGAPAELGRIEVAAAVAALITAICVALGLARGPAWPDRVAPLARFWAARARAALEGAGHVLAASWKGASAIKPALVRHRLPEAAAERPLMAFGASLAPGMLAVSLDAEGALLHVLHEDDGDDEDLALLAHLSRQASRP